MIDSVNSSIITEDYAKKTEKTQTTLTQTSDNQTSVTDSVTISGQSSSSVTYSSSLSSEDIENMQFNRLRSLVANLLEQQGISTKMILGENTEIDIASITPDEASELVSEDGYFGVEQTSERIFQFATSIAGGDTSKLDEIIAGIEDGFQKAYEAFGDWLPDICYDTYDALMEKLDNWAAESDSESIA